MASASLKRPSPSDVPFTDSGPVSPTNHPHWIGVKRRCGEMTQPSRIFLDSAALIGPLSDDVTSLIRNEVSKHHLQQQQQQQQQQSHHLHHNHHHHNQPQHQHSSNQHNHNQQSHHLQQQQQRDCQLQPQPGTSTSHHHQHQHHPQQNQNVTNTTGAQLDTPMLSIRQTIAICEQIIKDREQKLREEYDKILIAKLSEQHSTYVKYCQDHIVRRYNENNSHQDSYLS